MGSDPVDLPMLDRARFRAIAAGYCPDFESGALNTVFPLGRDPDFLWPLVPGSRADCN